MAHNLEMKDGKASIAFLGNRNDIWHRMGQEMNDGMSIETWAKEAGLDWEAAKMPAYFFNAGDNDFNKVDGMSHIVRKDTQVALGYVTSRYKIVQPKELLEWFQKYIGVDDNFKLDVAGCLKSGEIIWATAKYNGDITVAGDIHKARLLMTTTFDGTGSTINKMTMTRVVCNNTLDAALATGGTTVKTVHSAKFDAKAVGEQLAKLASSVAAFKEMGDAMGRVHMAENQVKNLFNKLLKIDPKDGVNYQNSDNELSTRKAGQFNQLIDAYNDTVQEGTEPNTAWCALNAVTRYVDHMRGTRVTEGMSEGDAKFIATQFTSGAKMKGDAVKMLKELCGV